jgi:hypothetical protein
MTYDRLQLVLKKAQELNVDITKCRDFVEFAKTI